MSDSLELLAYVNPDAFRLARFASLASRIEPELLRALRVELCDDADVSAEADLWWSEVAESRSPVALRLSPEVLSELRSQLFDDETVEPNARRRAREILRRVHAAEPSLVELEESLVYDALAGADPEALEVQLRPLLGTLLDDPKRAGEIAAWVIGSWPRLPERVRTLPLFWNILFAASAQGRGSPATMEAPPAVFSGELEVLARLPSTGWVAVEAKLTGEALALRRGNVVSTDNGGLLAPNLDPVLLEIRSAAGRYVVALGRSDWSKPVRVNGASVEIRAVDGRSHELRVEGVESVEGPAIDLLDVLPVVELLRHNERFAIGYGVGHNVLATDGTVLEEDERLLSRHGEIEREFEVVCVLGGVAILRAPLQHYDAAQHEAVDGKLRSNLMSVDPRYPAQLLRVALPNRAHAGMTWLHEGEALTVGLNKLLLPTQVGAPVISASGIIYQVARADGNSASLISSERVSNALDSSGHWLHLLLSADRFEELVERRASREEIVALSDELFSSEDGIVLGTNQVRRLWRSGQPGRRWLALGCIRRFPHPSCLDLVHEALRDSRSEYEHEEALEAERVLSSRGASAQTEPDAENEGNAPWRGSLGPFPWRLWRPGSILGVRFLDGSQALQRQVLRIAKEWEEHAYIRFEPASGAKQPNEIRVSFSADGSWSYHGTDCESVPEDAPTMNLQVRLDDAEELRRVVLHEFAHVLGFVNETQNPNAKIPWDSEALYAEYGDPPNHWSREDVDRNLLGTYQAPPPPEFPYRQFDPNSIMLHPISRRHTRGRLHTTTNSELSNSDCDYMERLYPAPVAASPALTNVSHSITGVLPPRATHYFHGNTQAPTRFVIETRCDFEYCLRLPNGTLVRSDNHSRDYVDVERGSWRIELNAATPFGHGHYHVTLRPQDGAEQEATRDQRGIEVMQRRLDKAEIPERTPDRLLIAAWNLSSFGQKPLRPETRALISVVLKRFDLTIIRNVHDRKALDEVLFDLGPSWRAQGLAKDSHGRSPFAVFDEKSVRYRNEVSAERVLAGAASRSLAVSVIGQFVARKVAFTVATVDAPPGQDDRVAEELAQHIPDLHSYAPVPNEFTLVTGLLGVRGPTSRARDVLARAEVSIPHALTRQGESPALDQILVYPRTPHFRDVAGLVDLYQTSPKALFPTLDFTHEQAIAELSVGSPAWSLFGLRDAVPA